MILYEFLNTKVHRLVPRTSCNKQIAKKHFVNQQFVKRSRFTLQLVNTAINIDLYPSGQQWWLWVFWRHWRFWSLYSNFAHVTSNVFITRDCYARQLFRFCFLVGFSGCFCAQSVSEPVGPKLTAVQKYRSCEQTLSIVCDHVHKVFLFIECCFDRQSCLSWLGKYLQDLDALRSVLPRKTSRSMERNAFLM